MPVEMDGARSPGTQSDEVVGDTTESSTPLSSVSASTHDTSRARYHMKELGTFAKRLEEAAFRAFPSRGRSRYKQVIAVLIQWEDDDLNLQPDIDRLRTLFDTCYGFYTETWAIPSASSHLKTLEMATNFVDDYGSPDNLFVVYYGGHAVNDSSGKSEWLCNQEPLSPSVNWSAIQNLLGKAKSDVLFLLDCATVPAETSTAQGINEIIGACGLENLPTGPGRHAFTAALISVLDDWTFRQSFSAVMLHSEVLAVIKPDRPENGRSTDEQTVEKGRTPIYLLTSGHPKFPSIELARRRGYDDPSRASANFSRPAPLPSTNPAPMFSKLDAYNPVNLHRTLKSGELQIPHVLISVALEEDQTLDVEAWYAWLREIPPLAAYAVVEGVYKSHSTMLLISIPLLLWDILPDDLAVSFVAYIQSKNLLAAESVEDFQRLTGSKLEVKARESKQLSTKTVQFSSQHVEVHPLANIDPPPLSAVKPHPLSIVDPPQVEKVRRHSLSKAEPPQLVDVKPHPLSTVDRLELSDLQLPQRLSKTEPPPSVEVNSSHESATSRPKLPASSSASEPKAKPSAIARNGLPLPKPGPSNLKPEHVVTEKRIKELVQAAQLAREEASRAWEELGRREKEDRVRVSALKAGKSIYINGIQVTATSNAIPERSAKAEAVLGTLMTPLNSTPAPRRGSGEEHRPKTVPPPQRGRMSLEERRPLMFDAGVRRDNDENKRPTPRKGLSFVDHKAKKLYIPAYIPATHTPQPPLSLNPISKDLYNSPSAEPPLHLPEPDPEVLKHMMSFQSKMSSAGPSPPVTPEKKKEDQFTFLDDEDAVVLTRSAVKTKGSKLVKKRRDSQSRGRKSEKRDASVSRWRNGSVFL